MSSEAKAYFETVYDETILDVTRYTVSKCGRLDDVQDVVQNVYTAFYRRLLAKGIDIHDVKAYLIKICKNELTHFYRRQKQLGYEMPLFSEDENEIHRKEELASASSIDYEACYENKALVAALWRDIQALPPDTARCLVLFYGYDMSLAEVGSALGLSESNVKNKIYRSWNALRQKYLMKGSGPYG